MNLARKKQIPLPEKEYKSEHIYKQKKCSNTIKVNKVLIKEGPTAKSFS